MQEVINVALRFFIVNLSTMTLQKYFCHKIAEEMEREKSFDGGPRQERPMPEPETQKSDLPAFRYGRTLKEMMASGKDWFCLDILMIVC